MFFSVLSDDAARLRKNRSNNFIPSGRNQEANFYYDIFDIIKSNPSYHNFSMITNSLNPLT